MFFLQNSIIIFAKNNKMNIKDINIQNYNYKLPEEKIAKYPLKNRENSKLLIYDKGEISHSNFNNILDYVNKNDFLVFNNTKVIQARLNFKKETGANIEVFCLEPIEPTDYSLIFQTTKSCKWKCIVGNLKKWKKGNISFNYTDSKTVTKINATKISSNDDSHTIEFTWDNPNLTFAEILEKNGQIPIPPYLKRKSEESDKTRYQTIYSKHKGSVAAPTAGLHFTEKTLSILKEKGTHLGNITLHVGAGTFKPVKTNSVLEHEMHTEHFSVTKEFIKNLINNLNQVIAVGTTTVRTLESLYFIGLKLFLKKENPFHINQWEVYDLKKDISTKGALLKIIDFMENEKIEKIEASTQIIIVPGYIFNIVNKLITNFHQPKSTLLLLISAFIGQDWKNIYKYALENNFRFLSYGDSSILTP